MPGFEGPIVLHLRPSASLRWTAVALHALAFVLIGAGYPAVLLKYLLLTAILFDAWRCDSRFRRPPAREVATLLLGANDSWQLIGRDGLPRRADLVRAPLVSPFVTALTFRCEDRSRRHVLLLGDNVDADAFRRLRVRLRRTDGDIQPI